jgi:hypothetical protein
VAKFTIFWIITYCAGLLAAFFNPIFGTYTYLFEYYLRPSIRWWGADLPMWGYNSIASAALIGAYFVRRSSLAKTGPLYNPSGKYLLLLGALMLVITPFAVSPAASWEKTISYFTLITFYFLIIGTVRTPWAFDGFIALHMAGSFYWGWEQWVNLRREAGRAYKVGSGDTLNDNFAAAHLLTILPFIAIYLWKAKDKRLRAIALVSAPFALNVFILCNSRGGTLGLAAALICAVFVARRRERTKVIALGACAVVAVLVLADPEYLSRQLSMEQDVQQEGSDWGGRRKIWEDGLKMLRDYPFGAGGAGFAILSPIYTPTTLAEETGTRAPHNTLLLVTAEWGFIGLILFSGYYVSVFRLLNRIRARAPDGDLWYYRAVAIQLSLVGVFVAGLFTDRLYGEAPYWMGGLAVALYRLQSYELAKAKQPAPATASTSQSPAELAEQGAWLPSRLAGPHAGPR